MFPNKLSELSHLSMKESMTFIILVQFDFIFKQKIHIFLYHIVRRYRADLDQYGNQKNHIFELTLHLSLTILYIFHIFN